MPTAPATASLVSPALSRATAAIQDLAAMLRARAPLIWIVSPEEERVERAIIDACKLSQHRPLAWDCASGISALPTTPVDESMTDPVAALRWFSDRSERSILIMRDAAKPWIDDPVTRRNLRNMCRVLPTTPRENARSVVVLSADAQPPADLRATARVIEWPLPDRTEIAALLDSILSVVDPAIGAALTGGKREAAIDAACGLTSEEASACYSRSLVTVRGIDPGVVTREKKRVISGLPGVEWIDPIAGGMDAVGGLDFLKRWLRDRRAAFTPEARAYGLPPPKGALLVGIPGCGKSLTAKCIAAAWGVPLVRLDLGALRNKYVGESEAQIRRALATISAIAPCVVWIDEVEKALGGASQGAADGGVSSDALATILTWLQDKAGDAFVVATANDVSALPPELLRKGRFDEVWSVDLPTAAERAEILRASLRAHGRERLIPKIDAATVAQASAGFTGSEVAELVSAALYTAFPEGREPETRDLVAAASVTAPLSRTASEKITRFREWAKGRARPASPAESLTTSQRGALDL